MWGQEPGPSGKTGTPSARGISVHCPRMEKGTVALAEEGPRWRPLGGFTDRRGSYPALCHLRPPVQLVIWARGDGPECYSEPQLAVSTPQGVALAQAQQGSTSHHQPSAPEGREHLSSRQQEEPSRPAPSSQKGLGQRALQRASSSSSHSLGGQDTLSPSPHRVGPFPLLSF